MSGLDATAGGMGLSVNQRLAAKNALIKLKVNEKFNDIAFWGKIQGTERDYLIAQATVVTTKIDKFRFFSHDNGVTFAKLPDLDSFIADKAPLHKGMFIGNPSQKLRDPLKVVDPDAPEDEEEEEEDAGDDENGGERKQPERRLTELERLAYAVDAIEMATCVVPKGSFFITAAGDICNNRQFSGLACKEAASLDNYVLFRAPQNERTLAKIRKAGVCNSVDFLDPLSEESPKGAWPLQVDKSGQVVTLRSLLWPGYEFTTDVHSNKWSASYFGLGQVNADLPFML